MPIASCPAILLTFADPKAPDGTRLAHLKAEVEHVSAALEPLEAAGRCKVVRWENATLKRILDSFQSLANSGRIAIFHYGGHANSYQLLLETAASAKAATDAGGLAAFLGRQRNLQLVFLNGCATRNHVDALLDAGVPLVIATERAVDDRAASELAHRFYASLAQGMTIKDAFTAAADG